MNEKEFFRLLDWLVDTSILFEYRITKCYKQYIEILLFFDFDEVQTYSVVIDRKGNIVSDTYEGTYVDLFLDIYLKYNVAY